MASTPQALEERVNRMLGEAQSMALRHMRAVDQVRRLVRLLERCEPDVPYSSRASDAQWIAALREARAFLAAVDRGTA
jgi:hypothetical protein